jgi:hypothetical protein
LKDGKLEGQTTETPAFELLPVSENEFVRRDSETKYVFAKAENGSSKAVTLSAPRGERSAGRIPDDFKIPIELLLAGNTDAAVKAFQDMKA